jgi:hypothetical protein
MTEIMNKQACADFQKDLPEAIASGEDLMHDPHLRSCELCQALLADLEFIADAARRLFPNEEPSDHVWGNIESVLAGEKNSLNHN